MQDSGLWPCFGIAKKIDYIIEVTGPSTVSQGSDLFGKGFFIGIATDSDPLCRHIAVVVKDDTLCWRQDKKLIECQVKLDTR